MPHRLATDVTYGIQAPSNWESQMMNEILTYMSIESLAELPLEVGLSALLGFVLGYLIRGRGIRRRMDAARAEGATFARTSIDGAPSLNARIDALSRERDWLQTRVEMLTVRSATQGNRSHEDGGSAGAAETAPAPTTAKLDAHIAEFDPSADAAELALDATAGSSMAPTPIDGSAEEVDRAEGNRTGDELHTKDTASVDAPVQKATADAGEPAQSDEEPLLLTNPIEEAHGTAEIAASSDTPPPDDSKHSFFHRQQCKVKPAVEDCSGARAMGGGSAVQRALAERIHRNPSPGSTLGNRLSIKRDGFPMSTLPEASAAFRAAVAAPEPEPEAIGNKPDKRPAGRADAMPDVVDSSDQQPKPVLEPEPANACEPGAADETKVQPKSRPVSRAEGRALFARSKANPGREDGRARRTTA